MQQNDSLHEANGLLYSQFSMKKSVFWALLDLPPLATLVPPLLTGHYVGGWNMHPLNESQAAQKRNHLSLFMTLARTLPLGVITPAT